MTQAPPSTGLAGAVRGLLRGAADAYGGHPWASRSLLRHLERFDEPLRLALAGKVKAGKSTLLNALVGEDIAPTDAGECTRVVTWYQDARAPGVTLHPRSGRPRKLPLGNETGGGALVFDLQGTPVEQVDYVVVDWPSVSLRATTLIDTPGIASLTPAASVSATGFLTPEDEPTPADAVLYLMRHLHAADVKFLESFHDQGVARAEPVNTVAVLSRADEIGVGRLDALQSAKRIAARYRSDERIRGLCQTVVAVAGLLAQTGRTLRQDEFAALTDLAKMPREELERLLLSADRFTSPEADVSLGADQRVRLFDRFGLFGLRLSTTMIRHGTNDPTKLSESLVRQSGLDELRQVLATQFSERRDVLKARSALLAVQRLLQREPVPAARPLTAEVERIFASAHEFAELRLLSALRARTVKLPRGTRDEAERLLGGEGQAAAARLGLERDASPAQLRSAALDALTRWRQRAESPLSSREVTDAARVVVRSCEGMLTSLPY